MPLKIVCISDTHNSLNQLELNGLKMPEADVLIHAGDLTFKGQLPEISKANYHLGKIKHKYKHVVFVPGNHDFLFQKDEAIARAVLSNATVLIDQPLEIEGYKFYGSPWQPWYQDWAFNFKKYSAGGKEQSIRIWGAIPEETDILITHVPPYMMMDKTEYGENIGDAWLAKRLKELPNLKLHVFGHVHERYGKVEAKITFVNAASMNRRYSIVNPPIVIDLP